MESFEQRMREKHLGDNTYMYVGDAVDLAREADAALDEMEFKNIALRGMVETRDTEIARLTDLNTAKGELIDFYTNYLSGISGYLATHQMSPSEAQVEYGNTLRARIRSLENE